MSHFKILKHLVILIVASAFTAACGEQEAPAPEQSLTEYLEAATMEQIKESPESISFLGLPEDQIGEKTQDRLDDRSPTADAKAKADFIAVSDQLKAYDRDTLSDDEKLYFDIATTVSERALPMLDRAGPFSPNFPGVYRITQLSGPHLGIPGLLQAQHPMNSIGDAEDFIARLSEVNRTFAEFIETWSGDLEAGLVPPRFALEKLSVTLTRFAEGEATANPLYQIFMARLEGIEALSDEDKQALQASAEEAVTTSVQPGYAAIKAKVDSLIEGAPTDAGVWAQPDGEARYASAVQIFGDTDLSPEQVHQLGLAEVERIVAEIDAIFDSQGITGGTAGERMKTLGENPDMVYPNSDEGRERLLAFLEENLALVTAKVPDYFSVIPEVGVEIRRVPEFSEATAPGGYYGPPSVDGSRPGIFWINLRDTNEQQLWPCHEAPGFSACPFCSPAPGRAKPHSVQSRSQRCHDQRQGSFPCTRSLLPGSTFWSACRYQPPAARRATTHPEGGRYRRRGPLHKGPFPKRPVRHKAPTLRSNWKRRKCAGTADGRWRQSPGRSRNGGLV